MEDMQNEAHIPRGVCVHISQRHAYRTHVNTCFIFSRNVENPHVTGNIYYILVHCMFIPQNGQNNKLSINNNVPQYDHILLQLFHCAKLNETTCT